jgi:hypothetical protein
MKRVSMILILVVVLAGGALGIMAPASQAQVYVPVQTAVVPWVGPNTPWVNYNNDWFLNGVLYYFFGNKIGWAPYYAYPPTYIVRPTYWYAPRWHDWYQAHPVYWQNFQRRYPYWRGHRPGEHYNQAFYNRYHHGQGNGWMKGYHTGPYKPVPPGNRHPQPAAMGPGHGPQTPAQPGHFQAGPPAHGQQGHYQPGQPAPKQQERYQHGQPAHGRQGAEQEGPQHSRPQE